MKRYTKIKSIKKENIKNIIKKMSNNPAFYKNSNTIKSKYNIKIMNNRFNN